MNTPQVSLSEIQFALTHMCSKSNLEEFVKSGNASLVERSLLESIPMDQLLFYSEGTYSKRHFFARDVFKLTSKAIDDQVWQRIVDEYWQNYAVDSQLPSKALSGLPSYLRRLVTLYDDADIWAELAEYEMCMLEVGNNPAGININDRLIPKRISRSTKILSINPTLRMRTFNYNIPRLSRQLKRGAKLTVRRLKEPLNTIFYLDPVTRMVRAQQVGGLVAELITLAQQKPMTIRSLFAVVRERFNKFPITMLEENLRDILKQLCQVNVISTVE